MNDSNDPRACSAAPVLILGLNYAPEMVGIGPYTADMASWLATRGHRVACVSAQPYYPGWTVAPEWRGGWRRAVEAGVEVSRCPIYVPANPSGAKRIVHHVSYAASALGPMLAAARRLKPRVVMAIAPSLMAAPIARLAARIAGARSWLHVQDFEIEAALATGLLDPNSLAGRLGEGFERSMLSGFDRISSISPQMCRSLARKGVAAERIYELRNWTDVDAVRPAAEPSPYRRQWGITAPHVALYSGNIANKQGIDIVVKAARLLEHRRDIQFVVCGDGPNRARLTNLAAGLPNIRFEDLQPRERLGEFLSLATVHLLPQRAEAADLVLPSKLTNIMASGRPVVATAAPGTGIADEIADCGIATPPGDAAAFAAAIAQLCDDRPLATRLGTAARAGAVARWSKSAILERFAASLTALASA